MKKEICVLFDMDGVVIDTETQYDKLWKHLGDRYNVGIENFEKVIKGTTLPNIIKKYFSTLTEDEKDTIIREVDKFESNMDFPEIPGSLQFINELKSKGIKVGLVTSSTQTKLNSVNKERHLDQLFDTIVAAERVEHGKPNPECYLLAAQDLNVEPQDCIVFEDSFNGIQAGKAAGMKVIGLATTHSADELRDKTDIIIPDFKNFSPEELQAII